MKTFVLASTSPRRKQLLEWAELPFEIIVKGTDESYPPGLDPEEVTLHIARQKAQAVLPLVEKGRLVLAADTIVVHQDRIIGKPADRQEAIDTLTLLSGNQHRVITGVIMIEGTTEIAFTETTFVEFHPLSKEQIVYYVDHYAPYDKAGAYAIQEWIGVIGIRSIKGDFYNVMGLPVSRVAAAIKSSFSHTTGA